MSMTVPITPDDAAFVADQLGRLAQLERDQLTAAAAALVVDREAGHDTRTRAGHIVAALAETTRLDDLAARLRQAVPSSAHRPTPTRED
jgi:hypothetical protein